MTTIAYSHKDKQIAYDSRSTMGGVVATDHADKMVERDGLKFFVAGSSGGIESFIAMHTGGEKPNNHPEVSAFMVDEEGAVWLCVVGDDMVASKSIIDYDATMGSGEYFALSAMDMGKCALDAVEYAKTRCIYTGGKVSVYDIGKKEVV